MLWSASGELIGFITRSPSEAGRGVENGAVGAGSGFCAAGSYAGAAIGCGAGAGLNANGSGLGAGVTGCGAGAAVG